MTNATHCPRCSSPDTELMTQSRTADWRVFLCHVCSYSWRSSEPEQFTRHELYDVRFRLTPEMIARFTNFPPVAARKNLISPQREHGDERPIRRGGMDV